MFTNKITVGTKVSYFDREHIVENIIPPFFHLQRIGDAAQIKVPITDLQNFGRIIYETDYNAEVIRQERKHSPLPEKENTIVEKRFGFIESVLEYDHFKGIGDLYCYVKKHPEFYPEDFDFSALTQEKVIDTIVRYENRKKQVISSRTIKRYLKVYRDYERKGLDGKLALIPKTGERVKQRKDNTSLVIYKPNKKDEISDIIPVRIPPKQAAILAEAIRTKFLQIKGPSIAELIDIVEVACLRKNLEPIKASTVYSIISRYNEAEKIRYRGSAKEVLNKVTSYERGFTDDNGRYPLHMVAIDHHKLDVLIVDDRGQVIGRACMTAGIDYFSRMIWGCHISFDEPSVNKTIKLFKHGLQPKNTKTEYDTENDYPICGKPDFIYFDNGSDFKTAEVEHIVTNIIGSTIMHRPVRNAKYGAVIERFFETLNTECIHRLDGTTKSTPHDLEDYKPEKFARYTLPELKKIIFTYIVDIYHVSLHRGLKWAKTPLGAYYKGIAAHGIPNYVSPEEQEMLRFNLMRQEKRNYLGDGLHLFDIRYKSDEADVLINPGVNYTVLYDDDDISTILLKHPKDNRLLAVPAVEPRREVIAGMNRHYFKWLLKLMDDGEKVDDKSIIKSKMKLQNLMNKQYDRSSRVRIGAAAANLPFVDIDTHNEPPEDEVLALLKEGLKKDKEVQTDAG